MFRFQYTFQANKMNLMFILTLILFFGTSSAADPKSAAWEYTKLDGFLAPEEWYKGYPQCSGREQSPIKISLDETVYDRKLRGVYVKYENPIDGNTYTDNMIWSIRNTGYTGI
jgi:carbonic anhydrase